MVFLFLVTLTQIKPIFSRFSKQRKDFLLSKKQFHKEYSFNLQKNKRFLSSGSLPNCHVNPTLILLLYFYQSAR